MSKAADHGIGGSFTLPFKSRTESPSKIRDTYIMRFRWCSEQIHESKQNTWFQIVLEWLIILRMLNIGCYLQLPGWYQVASATSLHQARYRRGFGQAMERWATIAILVNGGSDFSMHIHIFPILNIKCTVYEYKYTLNIYMYIFISIHCIWNGEPVEATNRMS